MQVSEVLEAHAQKEVDEAVLQQKLRTFIEEADMESAMATSQFDEANIVREDVSCVKACMARSQEGELTRVPHAGLLAHALYCTKV